MGRSGVPVRIIGLCLVTLSAVALNYLYAFHFSLPFAFNPLGFIMTDSQLRVFSGYTWTFLWVGISALLGLVT
jgi:hypothetical protein